MSRYDYSKVEQQINNVLAYQDQELKAIKPLDKDALDVRITESEDLLRSLGYQLPSKTVLEPAQRKPVIVVPSWEKLCLEAEMAVGTECSLESIFTPEEIASNSIAIRQLNDEFNALHRLDKYDIAMISVAAWV